MCHSLLPSRHWCPPNFSATPPNARRDANSPPASQVLRIAASAQAKCPYLEIGGNHLSEGTWKSQTIFNGIGETVASPTKWNEVWSRQGRGTYAAGVRKKRNHGRFHSEVCEPAKRKVGQAEGMARDLCQNGSQLAGAVLSSRLEQVGSHGSDGRPTGKGVGTRGKRSTAAMWIEPEGPRPRGVPCQKMGKLTALRY